MKAVVEHPDGRREDITFQGENFSLGLSASKHTCTCGAAEFVDGGLPPPPDERDPDRICGCGRKFWYYDDENEELGYLH